MKNSSLRCSVNTKWRHRQKEKESEKKKLNRSRMTRKSDIVEKRRKIEKHYGNSIGHRHHTQTDVIEFFFNFFSVFFCVFFYYCIFFFFCFSYVQRTNTFLSILFSFFYL